MRKKIEKRKSKNWGDMDKLDDSLNKMEVLTKHLNELFEENKKEEYRHVLQLDYLNECLTK